MIQQDENTSGYNTWGCMLQKNRVGRKLGRVFIYFSIFCHWFFSTVYIQRAYGTMKQNIIKFKHS